MMGSAAPGNPFGFIQHAALAIQSFSKAVKKVTNKKADPR